MEPDKHDLPQTETKPIEKIEEKHSEEKKEQEDDFKVNPYEISSTGNKEIDYTKLIQKFGCYALTQQLVDRM